MAASVRPGRVQIGISGFDYPRWRGVFYPKQLRRADWLPYASNCFSSIELNGTFYSLKSPDNFERWEAQTPESFLFALKGGRFLTHNLKLRRCETPLANFFASGPLKLGEKLGPVLWQLPASYRFDAERMRTFIRTLPRTHAQAAEVASRHDARLKRGAFTQALAEGPIRHTFEVRHPSYFHPEFYALLREEGCGFVVADSAGKFPIAYEVTSDFVYVRLHGSTELYVSGYSPEELRVWARRVRAWAARGLDVFVYFDNDAKVFAPKDALALRALVERGKKPARRPTPTHAEEAPAARG